MKRAVALLVVMSIMAVIAVFTLIALYVMTQEARLAEHKIKRMRAFYAAQAGMIHAQERLRRENNTDVTAADISSADLLVGEGLNIRGYPIPVNITVGPIIDNSPGIENATREINITVDY
ncbi:MAG: hypothetical protein ABH872_06960 [Candidatus Omnitrophota bacterium]